MRGVYAGRRRTSIPRLDELRGKLDAYLALAYNVDPKDALLYAARLNGNVRKYFCEKLHMLVFDDHAVFYSRPVVLSRQIGSDKLNQAASFKVSALQLFLTANRA
jgi:hypothetical protein